MELSQDYEDLFRVLNAYKIKYLVVGAHAVIFYSEPRFTKDLDIWVSPDMNDPADMYDALRAFGAPMKGVTPRHFLDKTLILQIGVAPIRIDVMMNIPGVRFRTAWQNKRSSRYGKERIYLLSIRDLIKAKRKAGRLQDKIDLEKLLERLRSVKRSVRKKK